MSGAMEPTPQSSLERGHEQRDLSIRMLWFSLVGLTVLTAVAIVAMAVMLSVDTKMDVAWSIAATGQAAG